MLSTHKEVKLTDSVKQLYVEVELGLSWGTYLENENQSNLKESLPFPKISDWS